MKRYWAHMVKSTEKTVERFLKMQINDRNRYDDGRMPSDIIEGKETIYLLTDAVALYCCEDSRYYKSTELLEAIHRGLRFIEKWQREDGSLDYPSCNFYSAPDTAFCFRRLFGAYKILEKYGDTPETENLERKYLVLLLRCIPILLYSGFHTPNHRWAVTATLFQLANLVEGSGSLALAAVRLNERCQNYMEQVNTPGELADKLRRRAAQYLAEGIDGDEDGEYAERSTGNYNAVVDKSLISAYEETGDEAYLEYVSRNLEMMLYYFDGDDTIFTQNSTRQDKGRATHPEPYFYLYAYMAHHTGNLLFDRAAHKIIRDNLERGDKAPDNMYIFMMYDWLKDYTFQDYGFLDTYRKYFSGSKVLRVKKKEYGYTVIHGKALFLFVKFGEVPISMRIGESYCDIRSFIPQTMEVTEDGCILSAQARGWYYQPFAESQGTSDWWEMDHSKRELVITSSVTTTVSLKEQEYGLEVTVKTEGLKGLPLRVEIDVPADCVLEGEQFRFKAAKGEQMILKSGSVYLHEGADHIEIGPGYGTHAFTGHYSGEDKNENGYCIFLNDYTPYERTFTIRRREDSNGLVDQLS